MLHGPAFDMGGLPKITGPHPGHPPISRTWARKAKRRGSSHGVLGDAGYYGRFVEQMIVTTPELPGTGCAVHLEDLASAGSATASWMAASPATAKAAAPRARILDTGLSLGGWATPLLTHGPCHEIMSVKSMEGRSWNPRPGSTAQRPMGIWRTDAGCPGAPKTRRPVRRQAFSRVPPELFRPRPSCARAAHRRRAAWHRPGAPPLPPRRP